MKPSTRRQRATATLVLIASCVLFGVSIGVMGVYLFPGETTPSWSLALANPGSLVFWGVLGGIAGGYLARDLSVTARWWSSAVAIVLALGTVWSIALTY